MAEAPAAAPLSQAEADRLLGASFAGFRTVVLAVSGGADSMALLALAAGWRSRARGGGPALQVATVDHGLRPESADEASWVGDQARALGLAHCILTWDGPKPPNGRQAAARRARYRLLAGLAASAGAAPRAVAVAHHQEDQAETLAMRLARGSSLDGLAGMLPQRALDRRSDVRLVRPLLAVPKARLAATLAVSGIPWREDPSNTSVAFERVRLRRAWEQLAAVGLTPAALATSARRLARAGAALRQATAALGSSIVDEHAGAYASLGAWAFVAAPEELRVRLMQHVLSRFGGAARPARLSEVEALLVRLDAAIAGSGRLGATLGGCQVELDRGEISVWRERGRYGVPLMMLHPGDTAVWDERFLISIASGLGQRLTVRTLAPAELAGLRRRAATPRPDPLPHAAALTLPSFWVGDRLVSAPLIAGAPACPAVTARFVGNDGCGAGWDGWT